MAFILFMDMTKLVEFLMYEFSQKLGFVKDTKSLNMVNEENNMHNCTE